MATVKRTEVEAHGLRSGPTGLAAADMVRTVRLEIRRTVAKAGGDQAKAVLIAIARLLSQGLITAADEKHLTAVAKMVFSGRGPTANVDVGEAVQSLYQQMAGDAQDIGLVHAVID